MRTSREDSSSEWRHETLSSPIILLSCHKDLDQDQPWAVRQEDQARGEGVPWEGR